MQEFNDDERKIAEELINRAQLGMGTSDGDIGVFLYDFYLKVKRGGFNEKQSLWLCADLLFGDHFNLGLEQEENPDAT